MNRCFVPCFVARSVFSVGRGAENSMGDEEQGPGLLDGVSVEGCAGIMGKLNTVKREEL